VQVSDEHVIHGDELPWSVSDGGELFAHRRRALSRAAGGQRLGCSMFEIDPNKTAFPFHYHLGNEEAVYVLQGVATLRLGSKRVRVRAGDYIALPVGEEHAHQLTNTGDDVFRYLVISTMREPDAIVYPDSDKVGVIAGSPPGGASESRVLTAFFPRGAAVPYEHGESGVGLPETSEPADLDARVDAEFEELKRKLGHEEA
jgi:uncharacterized cupin superfamily protein